MDIEQIKDMLISTDAQNRRLAFGLIFNNLETISSETLLAYKALYFAHMSLENVTANYHKPNAISVSDVINDMTFVIEHLSRSEEDLNKVFMFSPKSMIENIIKQEQK
jgi:hypothetical protein